MQFKVTGVLVDGSTPITSLPTSQTLSNPQGDDGLVNLAVKNSAGAAVNLAGCVLLFTIKRNPTDTSALVSRLGTITDVVNGLVTFTIAESDTNTLSPTVQYYYDVWMTGATGNRDQLIPVSNFNVLPALGLAGQPVTTPQPVTIVGYGLPTLAADNKFLQEYDTGGGVAGLRWAVVSSGGYQTVKDSSGNPLTQRTSLKFGADFTVTDTVPDTVVALALVGPGAGTIGGGANYINSLTLDAEGRVTAAATGTPSGGAGYATIQSPPGTGLTQRPAFSVDGALLVATDNPGSNRTDLTLGANVVRTTSIQTLTAKTINGLTMSGTWTGQPTWSNSQAFPTGTSVGNIIFSDSGLTAARTFTFPDLTGTVATIAATQTITNKAISGSSNTLSNIANGSLVNSSVTVNPGSGLQNGGSVALGASITLDLLLNASGGLVKNLGGGTNELGIAAAGVTNAMLANSTIGLTANAGILVGTPSVALGGSSTLAVDQAFTPTWTGEHIWDNDAVGVTQAVVMSLQNNAVATTGVQKFSGVFEQTGSGFNSTAVAGQAVKIGSQVRGIQTAGVPSAAWSLYYSGNGSAYASPYFQVIQVGNASSNIIVSTPTRMFIGVATVDSTAGITGSGFDLQASAMNVTVGGGNRFAATTAAWNTSTDVTSTLGDSTHRWKQIWAREHYGISQTVTSSGAITIDPTAGEQYKLLANGNVTGLTLTAATAGAQRIHLTLVQNAAGTATWPTTITNCRLIGGTFTKTVTANAVDVLSFVYNATDSKWDQIAPLCANIS